jgi:predicted NBD/HSP70 family sugar kinase
MVAKPEKDQQATWVRVAHVMLLHGQRLYGHPQKDFWRLVVRGSGQALDEKTCERNVNRMTRYGAYFAKDPFRFGPGMGLVIGVSIGTESLRAALIDANGWIQPAPGNDGAEAEHGQDDDWHLVELQPAVRQADMSTDELVGRVAEAAWRVADRALSDQRLLVGGKLPLLGVAVAWPTPLGRKSKMPTSAALSDPAWREEGGPSVRERVAERLGIPEHRSHAINDANAVALAAAFDEIRKTADAGDGRFGRTMFALRIGGGLGAGTVVIGSPVSETPRSAFLETRLIEGDAGFAGELGHLPVDLRDVDDVQHPLPHGLQAMPDIECVCGRRNGRCLQTFASATAFSERMRASSIGVAGLLDGDDRHSTSVMLRAMRNVNDDRQRRAQRDIGRLIGRSLAAPVLMLNPSSITMAGSLAVDDVRAGIEDERGRWRHAHSDILPLHLLEGRANRYSAARGAAVAAFRGRVYRRFEDLNVTEPLSGLTLKWTGEDVAPWHPERGWKLFY